MICEPSSQYIYIHSNFYKQQGILVVARKDLSKRVRLGSVVTVVGVPTFSTTFMFHHLLIEIIIEVFFTVYL